MKTHQAVTGRIFFLSLFTSLCLFLSALCVLSGCIVWFGVYTWCCQLSTWKFIYLSPCRPGIDFWRVQRPLWNPYSAGAEWGQTLLRILQIVISCRCGFVFFVNLGMACAGFLVLLLHLVCHFPFTRLLMPAQSESCEYKTGTIFPFNGNSSDRHWQAKSPFSKCIQFKWCHKLFHHWFWSITNKWLPKLRLRSPFGPGHSSSLMQSLFLLDGVTRLSEMKYKSQGNVHTPTHVHLAAVPW